MQRLHRHPHRSLCAPPLCVALRCSCSFLCSPRSRLRMVHTTSTSSETTRVSGEKRRQHTAAQRQQWWRCESPSLCAPFPLLFASSHLSSWRRLSVSGRRRRSRARARAGGGARHGGRHRDSAVQCSEAQRTSRKAKQEKQKKKKRKKFKKR